ncbi:MAG TPA: cytochrome c maturation protein CcmE, partial [Gammaproteobacteria bacterium]|nr:cytochrome c maturation protein CcmE [Gammaproteobacteria bacterium]
MTPRKKRILVVCMMIAGISVAALLILTAFEKNLMYFYSPTEIINGEAPQSRSFRIGGLVVSDTVIRNPDDLKVSFVLTDTVHEIKVIYDGILPDLFREGQGIVANGKLKSENVFVADEVLAKHDEN